MLFDASDIALGMLSLNQRCAVRLLLHAAVPEVRSLWIPRFDSREWGATICISEPQAGSDVGRIRTRALPEGTGKFRITGLKCWISYGDHDLTAGIVHFILAREPDIRPARAAFHCFCCPIGLRMAAAMVRRPCGSGCGADQYACGGSAHVAGDVPRGR